jgi:hypothetical protein
MRAMWSLRFFGATHPNGEYQPAYSGDLFDDLYPLLRIFIILSVLGLLIWVATGNNVVLGLLWLLIIVLIYLILIIVFIFMILVLIYVIICLLLFIITEFLKISPKGVIGSIAIILFILGSFLRLYVIFS